MLHRAEPIRGERTSGPQRRIEANAAPAGSPSRSPEPPAAGRTFRFPNGRFWSVAEWASVASGPTGGARTVLRFSAGARSLDLADWPREWRTLSDSQLAELLVTSFPRAPKTNPTTYRRRAGD